MIPLIGIVLLALSIIFFVTQPSVNIGGAGCVRDLYVDGAFIGGVALIVVWIARWLT